MKKIRIIILVIAFVILFMFIAPIFGSILNIGNIFGIILGTVLLILGIFLDRILAFCKKLWCKSFGKAVISILCAVIILCSGSFFTALCSVIASSSTNADNQSTVIVLGCAVYGETPSIMLKARVDSAYDYLFENKNSVAVLSGGQGDGESISEAECMYRLLTEKGIDPNRLFKEEQSTNTSQNIYNSKQIILKNNLSTNVAIVSSDFHLKRASMIAQKKRTYTLQNKRTFRIF